MKTKIYAVDDPFFLADIFIFSTKHRCEKFPTVYIKINGDEKIEEVGVDIARRMRLSFGSLEDIIDSRLCREATESQKRLLNSIGAEYFHSRADSESSFYRRLDFEARLHGIEL